MSKIALVSALSAASALAGSFPAGPSQQCADDAGPPWADDGEVAYYVGYPNTPVLRVDGSCPPPLKAACDSKGPLAAHLDGPVNCGGKGWFCRIRDQPGHRMPGIAAGLFPDSNYASCNQADADHDRDGHCHGSDSDQVYGWWVRDHWHRNYAGTLKCCCGWEGALTGIVNRCDYRKPVKPSELDRCRDANEEHNVDMSPGCTAEHFANYQEPPDDQCWELMSFGPGPYEEPPGVVQPPYEPPVEETVPPTDQTAPPTQSTPPPSSPTTATTMSPVDNLEEGEDEDGEDGNEEADGSDDADDGDDLEDSTEEGEETKIGNGAEADQVNITSNDDLNVGSTSGSSLLVCTSSATVIVGMVIAALR